MTDTPAPAQPLTPGQFVEKEARRLSGPSRAHRGAIPARFWRDAIDAQAHDHDPSSCGECRDDFLLRFVPASLSPEWNAEMQTAWAEGFEAGQKQARPGRDYEPDRESSCMVCGLVAEPGVWNDPTGVYVCVRCRDAARARPDALREAQLVADLVWALERRIREFAMPSETTDWQAFARETLILGRARAALASAPAPEDPE